MTFLPAAAAARPLVWLALFAAIGISAAYWTQALVPWWLWGSASFLTTGLAFRWPKVGVLLGAAFFVFGFLHTVTLMGTLQHPLYRVLEARSSFLDITARGDIIKPLRRDLPGAEAGQAWFVADRVRAPLLGKEWQGRTSFRIRLLDRQQDLPPGRYQIEGRVSLAPLPDNPGQFDEREYDLRRGITAELRPTKSEAIALDRWNLRAALDTAAEACREWVKRTLETGMGGDDKARAIVTATILGGAEAGARDLEEPFRATGTLHIFAVAGLHVGIVGLILRQLLVLARMPRRVTTAVLIMALFAYSFITGLRPSTFRAAVMAAVFLGGTMFNRRSDMLNSMGGAALILLAADTAQLFSTGFQLSFAVITAIALLNHRFMNLLRGWALQDPFLPRPLLNRWQRALLVTRFWLAEAVAISAASWIGSLPLTLYYFHLVTPIALAANIVLVPVAFFMLFGSLLLMLFTVLHVPWLPLLLGNANWAWGRFAMLAAHGFASLPGGNFYVSGPALLPRAPVEITVLRLRSGAAQDLRVKREHWLLDTGGDKDYRFLLHPYLNDAGVNRLQGVVLSNGGFEHAGGVTHLLQDVAPQAYYLPAAENAAKAPRNSTLGKLRELGVTFMPLSQGDRLPLGSFGKEDKVMLTVLYPPGNFHAGRSDDRSMIARVEAGRFRILWCGDAGFNAEKALLSQKADLRCDVLLRNQRAGDFSLLPEFLDAAQPRAVVSSNNRALDNKKLPEQTREDCRKRGILLLDQAQTGAVSVRLWPERMEIQPFHGKKITLEARPSP